jgi:hypothetical protein
MELIEVMEYLLTEGFVTIHKGKPKFTSHFQKCYNGVERGLTLQGTVIEPGLPVLASTSTTPLLVPTSDKMSLYKYEDWAKVYMQFIEEAQVPRRAVNAQGEPYDTNKYSEDGMKAFQKAMKSGADYKMLVRSTTLYYKGANRFKKAIGNYMAHGDWRTDYTELTSSAQQGVEQVAQHIKDTLNDGTRERYSWG